MTRTTDTRLGFAPSASQDFLPADSVDVSDFFFEEADVLSLIAGASLVEGEGGTGKLSEGSTTASIGSTFDIVIHYSGDSTYQGLFDAAAVRWEQIITADIPDVNTASWGFIDDLVIEASVAVIDGAGQVLGQAGPDGLRSGSRLPYHGEMEFDSADVGSMFTNGTFDDVILHEMGHILGIGTIWNLLGLRSGPDGFNYIGMHAVAEYRTLTGDQSKTFVPLESSGGSGTAGSHWSESVFNNELMTGYVEAAGVPMPVSRLTIASLWDLGYTVNLSAADPYTLPGAPPPAADDYADSLADMTAPRGQVAVNGASTGTLEVMGDRDWFTVQLAAGWSYVFNLEGTATGAGTLSDPYLRFRDSAGGVLARNDDISSSNLNSQLAFVAAASGTYYLEAGAFSDAGAGTYRMSISGTAPTVATPTTPPPTTTPAPTAPLPSSPSQAPAAFNTIARPVDFNGDGRDDLLWHTDAGQVVTWHMNGSQVASTQSIGSAGFAWHLSGTGDFNGNGQDDILWRSDTGQVVTWLLNGGQLASATAVGSAAAGWHIAGTGDFNSDGRDDILWHSDTGQVSTWLMNGGQLSSIISVGSAPMSAHIAATGDFNADGRTDILWRSENGQVSTWLMNGGQIASATTVGSAGAAWHIAATGDLNSDGRDDIIWRNEDGRVSTWLMNGGQLSAAGDSGSTGTAWHVAGSGDLNGDGRDEILWRNDDGHVAEWVMNGTQLASAADLGSLATTWHIGGSQFDLV